MQIMDYRYTREDKESLAKYFANSNAMQRKINLVGTISF